MLNVFKLNTKKTFFIDIHFAQPRQRLGHSLYLPDDPLIVRNRAVFGREMRRHEELQGSFLRPHTLACPVHVKEATNPITIIHYYF